MPIVIDACCANALADGGCHSSLRIREWVRIRGRVLSGGHLQKELGVTKLRGLLAAWSAAGKLIILPDALLNPERERISQISRSNDAHVLAVVSIGDAGVIVTSDQALKDDLKDTKITGKKRKIISHGDNGFSSDRIVQSLLRDYA